MKILFLIPVFLLMIFTVHAKKPFTDYNCEASYKNSTITFELKLSEKKEIELDGWKIYAAMMPKDSGVEVSLSRIILDMNTTYQKVAKRSYSSTARTLPVQLIHGLAGRTDIFNMICFPKSDTSKDSF
ncbi:MAG: hypothetical protein NDI69_02050 [Bacteriovoracaceae bacterium]|nr:hypothetical protein [Bacteriovoracaceae bacterium]